MALGATVFRVSLAIADMDRHHYQDYRLTLARHPSEIDQRMMLRCAAFCFHADEALTFTQGLCAEKEPELWHKDDCGEVVLWIDLGQLDEKRIRKACGIAEKVIIYTYHEKSARAWWQQQSKALQRFHNLEVRLLHAEGIDALVHRSMALQCSLSDGVLHLHDDHGVSVVVHAEHWK